MEWNFLTKSFIKIKALVHLKAHLLIKKNKLKNSFYFFLTLFFSCIYKIKHLYVSVRVN